MVEASAERGHAFIDVVGFSLGTRVVFHAISESLAPRLVRNVVLCGGAFPARRSWWNVAARISGQITNFSSRHDSHLRLYESYLVGGRSIGRPGEAPGVVSAGIHTRLRVVVNIDVSDTVAGHVAYYRVLDKLIDAAEPPTVSESPLWDWRDEFRWSPPIEPHKDPASARGAQTEIVQRALTAPIDGGPALLDRDDIDGIPGPRTEAALEAFQRRNGLDPIGKVGPKTWAALVGSV